MAKQYYVYILASRPRILYIGITNNLLRRIAQRNGEVPGFTSQYRIHRLVYFEPFRDVRTAIAREKQIKGWQRAKQLGLAELKNPTWDDLAESFFARFTKEEKADPLLRSG